MKHQWIIEDEKGNRAQISEELANIGLVNADYEQIIANNSLTIIRKRT